MPRGHRSSIYAPALITTGIIDTAWRRAFTTRQQLMIQSSPSQARYPGASVPVEAQKPLGIFDKRNQSRESQWTTSEIRRGKLIGSLSLPFIGLYSRGLNRGPVRVEGEKKTRFIAFDIRLQAFERVFSYKERPLHGVVMPPESNGTSSRVEDTALVGKVEHGSLDLSSVSSCDPAFSQPVGVSPTNNLLPDCDRLS